MASATVITYTRTIPSDGDAARHLAGPVVPTLAKLWRETYTTLPDTYFLLVHEEGAHDHGHSGPVRRLNPPGSSGVPVVCTMTDDPEAEHSRYCVWKLGSGANPAPST